MLSVMVVDGAGAALRPRAGRCCLRRCVTSPTHLTRPCSRWGVRAPVRRFAMDNTRHELLMRVMIGAAIIAAEMRIFT